MKIKPIHYSKKLLKIKFVKFFITGLSAFAIDLILLNIFSFLFFRGTNYSILNIISVPKLMSSTVALIWGFIINRNWVFSAKTQSYKRQAVKYIAYSIFNVIFGSVLFNFFYPILSSVSGVLNLSENLEKALSNTLANVITAAIQMCTSFVAYKYLVFTVKTKQKEEISDQISVE